MDRREVSGGTNNPSSTSGRVMRRSEVFWCEFRDGRYIVHRWLTNQMKSPRVLNTFYSLWRFTSKPTITKNLRSEYM